MCKLRSRLCPVNIYHVLLREESQWSIRPLCRELASQEQWNFPLIISPSLWQNTWEPQLIMRKGRSWFIALEVSVHAWLLATLLLDLGEFAHHRRSLWQSKSVHLQTRKWRGEGEEETEVPEVPLGAPPCPKTSQWAPSPKCSTISPECQQEDTGPAGTLQIPAVVTGIKGGVLSALVSNLGSECYLDLGGF
jgi:hypothetical protein